MQLYGNTISLPRYRTRTASIRRQARIISRGGTDNAQIYSKSRTDTKRKQKETGEVPPLTQCTRGACAYLHAVVTSADDTSAHFFFAHRISKRSAHTHPGEGEKDDACGDEREKDDLPHTRARLYDVWSSIPDTRRYINVERKSVGRRKKSSESEKDGKRKEKRDGM